MATSGVLQGGEDERLRFEQVHRHRRLRAEGEQQQQASHVRELPDMMSASEGGGGHGKAYVVREVAWLV